MGPILVIAVIFSGLASMPCSENDEPQEHASRNAENTFLRVELDVFCSEAFERNVEVVD
jgi:hypothetical protein